MPSKKAFKLHNSEVMTELAQYLWGAKIYLKFIYLIMDP